MHAERKLGFRSSDIVKETIDKWYDKAIKENGKQPKTKRKNTEAKETIKVATWLDNRTSRIYPGTVLYTHVANESYGVGPIAGRRRKLMGVKAGVYDFIIFESNIENVPGAIIEMKTDKNKLTDSQKWFRDAMVQRGWLAATCYSADEAISVLEKWGF